MPLRSHAAAEAMCGAGARVTRHGARAAECALGARGCHQRHARQHCQVMWGGKFRETMKQSIRQHSSARVAVFVHKESSRS